MSSLTIPEAFKAHGLRATFKNNPAMIVPVTTDIADQLDQSKIKNGVTAGQLLVSWNDGENRHGQVLNSDAINDLSLLVERNDLEPKSVSAENWLDATVAMARLRNTARDNEAHVAEFNDKLQTEYQDALERGETVKEPEYRKPEFVEGAFASVDTLISFTKEKCAQILNDPLSDIGIRGAVDTFSKNIRAITGVEVTSAEVALIKEARQLRAEIGVLNPDHPDALKVAMPKPYEGDGAAARALASTLPYDPDGISAAQQSVMVQHGDLNLVNKIFSVATSTNPMQLGKAALSHRGHQTIAQDLAKFENKEAGTAVISRMKAVLKDAMETYEWDAKLYTKTTDDGPADVLLMRDRYAAFAYVWDSESRVDEVDVDLVANSSFTKADVPTSEDIERLKATLEEMRFDNGAEIDFDFDDPEDEMEF